MVYNDRVTVSAVRINYYATRAGTTRVAMTRGDTYVQVIRSVVDNTESSAL